MAGCGFMEWCMTRMAGSEDSGMKGPHIRQSVPSSMEQGITAYEWFGRKLYPYLLCPHSH